MFHSCSSLQHTLQHPADQHQAIFQIHSLLFLHLQIMSFSILKSQSLCSSPPAFSTSSFVLVIFPKISLLLGHTPSPGGNARLLPGPPAASPNPNQQRCFFSQDTFPGAEREGRCPCCFPWGLRRGVEGDSGGDTVALSQPGEASGSNGPGPGTPPEQARSPSHPMASASLHPTCWGPIR